MVLTAVFVVLAALPTAGAIDGFLTFLGNRVASKLEERRVARLLLEIEQDMAVIGVNEESVDAWVAEECGADLLDPFDEVVIGGRTLRMSARQYSFLEEAVDDEDEERLRPLLTKVLLQTCAAAAS